MFCITCRLIQSFQITAPAVGLDFGASAFSSPFFLPPAASAGIVGADRRFLQPQLCALRRKRVNTSEMKVSMTNTEDDKHTRFDAPSLIGVIDGWLHLLALLPYLPFPVF
jgi:hypothetical protein